MYTLLLGLTLSNIIPSRPSIFNYVLEEKGFLFHSALCLLKLGKWLVSMSTTEDIEQKVFWRCWNHWIFLEFIFSFLWNKLFMCHANLAKMINYLLCCIEIREMLCSPFWIFSMCWPPSTQLWYHQKAQDVLLPVQYDWKRWHSASFTRLRLVCTTEDKTLFAGSWVSGW